MFKIALISCLFISSFLVDIAKTQPTNVQRADSENSFDWKLVQTALADKESNALISPILVKHMLSLIADGAPKESQTYREIAKLLPQFGTEEETVKYWNNIMKSLQDESKDYKSQIASMVFVDRSISVNRDYYMVATRKYDSMLSGLNFKDTKRAAYDINSWVSGITEGHIKKLFEEDQLEDVKMALVNALYFKGKWQQEFISSESFNSVFESPEGKVNATYMTQTSESKYVNLPEEKLQVLRLPYRGGKFAMYILLPNPGLKLSEFVGKLDSEKFSEIKSKMQSNEVDILIPKFKFDYTVKNLQSSLENLGVQTLFSDAADLSKISGSNNLKVSQIVQKTEIIVDEEGTTASGATGATLDNRFANDKDVFWAQRPFFFLIEDETTNAVLFAGKVVTPVF